MWKSERSHREKVISFIDANGKMSSQDKDKSRVVIGKNSGDAK